MLGLGLFVGCWVVSTRVVRSSRPGSTGLEVVKLVEPACDEGAGRVETVVRVSKVLGLGLFVGCWVVSTRVVRSSRPGSTGFMKTHPQVLSHPFCALRAREGECCVTGTIRLGQMGA